MNFDDVLKTFTGFFDGKGIRYAVAGGLAVHAWGMSRTTVDIDFVVDGTQRKAVIGFAESIGYSTRHESAGYSNHEHRDERFGNVDFIYVYGDTADRLFGDSVRRFTTKDIALPVPRPEHLIAMKVAAIQSAPRRVPLDVPDIRFLMSLPGLDRPLIREYFDRHGLLKIHDELEKERGP